MREAAAAQERGTVGAGGGGGGGTVPWGKGGPGTKAPMSLLEIQQEEARVTKVQQGQQGGK